MDKKIYRGRIIEKLNDLLTKIKTNEPLPEAEQDLNFLVAVDDKLEECLNAWNY